MSLLAGYIGTPKTCVYCGVTFAPYIDLREPLSEQRRRWNGQRLCQPCRPRWDIRRCWDGREHEMVPLGSPSADVGPLEGGPYDVLKCSRCGVASIAAPLENVLAANEVANARRRREA